MIVCLPGMGKNGIGAYSSLTGGNVDEESIV